MILRKANIYDINDIANVHCEVWNEFYGKYVSKEFIAKLSFEHRKKFWIRYINNGHIVFVIEEKQGAIVGFAVPQFNRRNPSSSTGEILAHYMSKKFQNKKFGTALLVACAKLFVKNNINSMHLWIHRDNPSTAVYRKLGAEEDGAKLARLDSKDIVKLKYKWDDISAFIDRYQVVIEEVIKGY